MCIAVGNNFPILILLDLTNRIGTNEVDTYCFPWDHFWILGVEFFQLGMLLFVVLA